MRHLRGGNKVCRSCTTTVEPLVPRMPCENNDDCVLVNGGGCCDSHAVHVSKEGDYNTRLEAEREKLRQERLAAGEGELLCGCSPRQESAVCVQFETAMSSGNSSSTTGGASTVPPQKFCAVVAMSVAVPQEGTGVVQ